MASLEIVAIDAATPQLRAPGGTDTYAVPKDLFMGDGKYIHWGVGGASFPNGIQSATAYSFNVYINGYEMARFNYANMRLELDNRWPVAWGTALGSVDTGIDRKAAKVARITDGAAGAGALQLPAFTVANLPTVANAGPGARATVSDATVAYTGANIGSTVVGGGANTVPVMVIGANWVIGG